MKAALWAYPWDLLDEGLDGSLARIKDAGLDAVSVATSYHAGMLLTPHNPRQKVHFLEDGVVYFRAGPDAFGEIKPVLSQLVLGRARDPLEEIVEAAHRHGLGVIGWTVALHNTRLGMRFPAYAAENAFGDRHIFSLCPSQPAVQEYVAALTRDLGQRYDLQAVQLEAAHFMPFNHDFHHYKVGFALDWVQQAFLSLCFCGACLQRAEEAGVDGETLRIRVREWLVRSFEDPGQPGSGGAESPEELEEQVPGTLPYLHVRAGTVASLLRKVQGATSREVRLIVPSGTVRRPWLTALDLASDPGFCDGFDVNCYYEAAEDVRRDVSAVRAATGGPLGVGLSACEPLAAGPDDLARKLEAAAGAGADAATFYNYGLMPLRNLSWVEEALARLG